MKTRNLLILGLFILWGTYVPPPFESRVGAQEVRQGDYYCPMHPDFKSDKPGSCPVCGMDLVKKAKPPAPLKKPVKKILFYRNPMNPDVTSPVPMKDSMGMDYVPVYDEDEGTTPATGVVINSEKQQLIGVKKDIVRERPLSYVLVTVGQVAYDPDLYVAQSEYLKAVKAAFSTQESALRSITEQMNSLAKAAEQKLSLLGMNRAQIEDLKQKGEADESLYLSTHSTQKWIYLSIYEYESGLVKEGLPVGVEAVAFPGQIFHGKISSLAPVLNAETRALEVRAEVADPDRKLKPQMFVNVTIRIDLGEKLAVPETAVLDTGVRKIVYVYKTPDIFEPRMVFLGQKAQGFYEVVGGLAPGDEVVTSGNFLIDSESQLKGVRPASVSSNEHSHD